MFFILTFITFSFTFLFSFGSVFIKCSKIVLFFPKPSLKFWSSKKKQEANPTTTIPTRRLPIDPSPQTNTNSNKSPEESNFKKTYEKELSLFAVRPMKISSHHYLTTYINNTTTNTTKIKRLTAEMKQIANFLPIYYSNSIFVRYDDSRMDVMKALIIGAEDTPYANGAFLFDIYFENTYPTTPPKVNLMTTGGNKVRFNPNLYNNGYVCLSLLGTWSGGKGEVWSMINSNLLQILISIQSLVMTEGVIYNEPSYSYNKANISYQKQDIGYTNIVKFGNIKYAMTDIINNPPAGFEDVVKKHFFYKKNDIRKTCDKWLAEAEKNKQDAEYSGLVSSHNYELANLFSKSKDAYKSEFEKEIQILKNKLDNLDI